MSDKPYKDERGFMNMHFRDVYGLECSIQQSSSACEARIWLGIHDAKPEIMASQAEAFGVPTNGVTTGWVPFPIPKEVLLHTRMHLNVEQVKKLIATLQLWVETEEIR